MIDTLLLMLTLATPAVHDHAGLCLNLIESKVMDWPAAVTTAIELECDDVLDFAEDDVPLVYTHVESKWAAMCRALPADAGTGAVIVVVNGKEIRCD